MIAKKMFLTLGATAIMAGTLTTESVQAQGKKVTLPGTSKATPELAVTTSVTAVENFSLSSATADVVSGNNFVIWFRVSNITGSAAPRTRLNISLPAQAALLKTPKQYGLIDPAADHLTKVLEGDQWSEGQGAAANERVISINSVPPGIDLVVPYQLKAPTLPAGGGNLLLTGCFSATYTKQGSYTETVTQNACVNVTVLAPALNAPLAANKKPAAGAQTVQNFKILTGGQTPVANSKMINVMSGASDPDLNDVVSLVSATQLYSDSACTIPLTSGSTQLVQDQGENKVLVTAPSHVGVAYFKYTITDGELEDTGTITVNFIN